MTSVISKNTQKLARWWILDVKNGERSTGEVLEYETLTQTLLASCKLEGVDALRQVAAKVTAERLKRAM